LFEIKEYSGYNNEVFGTWKWNSDETHLILSPPVGYTDPAWTFNVTEPALLTLKGT
jgi:hypothetical protein